MRPIVLSAANKMGVGGLTSRLHVICNVGEAVLYLVELGSEAL
jgi:hypothetical protein